MVKAKFNKEIVKDIITLYENGLNISRCADFVGVNRSTIHKWYNRGRDCEDHEDEYYKFYAGMLQAKAKFLLYHQKQINDSQDWRAHKYLLEVTDPETYVLEKRLNIKSDEDVKVKLTKEDIFTKVDKELGLYDKEEE